MIEHVVVVFRHVLIRESACEQAANSIESLKRDNVILFEKMRYLESFGQHGGGAHRVSSRNSDIERGNFSLVDVSARSRRRTKRRAFERSARQKKYSDLYEEKLNPFQAFTANVSSAAAAARARVVVVSRRRSRCQHTGANAAFDKHDAL